MNHAFLQRDKGPVVQVGHDLKGCVIITQDLQGTVSAVTDGLNAKEEVQALERALAFAKSKLDWKPPRKERKENPKDPNSTIESWVFETPAQGQHFAFQMALAGLPVKSKPVQS